MDFFNAKRMLLLVGLMCSTISASLVEIPRDTAALKDSTMVQLNCSPSVGSNVMWKVSFKWDLDLQQIYPIPSNTPNNPNFTLSQDGTILHINKLTNDLATVYRCSAGPDNVDVRVVSMDPVTCPNDVTVKMGDVIDASCSSNFYGYVKSPIKELLPTIYILDQSENVVAKEQAVRSGALEIAANLTAQPSMDGKTASCRVDFNENTDATPVVNAVAARPAEYEDICTFVVYVEHPVTEVLFTNLSMTEVNHLTVGDVINCTSDGRPLPTYQWSNSLNTSNTMSTGPSLTIEHELVTSEPITITCLATNTYDHVVSTASATIQVLVSPPYEESKQPGVEPWVIAISVLIPLLFILILVILLVVCCLRRKKDTSPYKPAPYTMQQPKKTKGPYTTTATDDVIYTPNRQPPQSQPFDNNNIFNPALPPSSSSQQQPTKKPKVTSPTKPVPSRPMYSNVNDFNDNMNPNLSVNANSGHGALGMTGINRSQDFHYNSRGQLVEPPYPNPSTNISAVDGIPMVPMKRVEGRQQASNPKSQTLTNAAEPGRHHHHHRHNSNNNNNNDDDDDDDEDFDDDDELPISPPPPKQQPKQQQQRQPQFKPLSPQPPPPQPQQQQYKPPQGKMAVTRESSVTSGSSTTRSNDIPKEKKPKKDSGKKSTDKYTGSGNMVSSPRGGGGGKGPNVNMGVNGVGFRTSGGYDVNSLQGSEV